MPQIRIGISGWTYPPWRRVFYPDGLPQRRELEFASRQVGSIEINGTFYALQQPESFRGWAEQTPDEFVFSVKGGRFITHLKKLRDVDTALANFLASGVLALGPKLGPLLWQLPPNLGYDAERVEAFVSLLPRTTTAAAELAAQHDDRVADRAWITTDADRPVRHAIEVRHASYETPSFFALLRAYGVAAVTADTAGRWPLIEEQTADFSYVRLHGAEELYSSGYSDEALDGWATKVRAWGQGRDVFVYFDNDVKVRAPFDAMGLMRRLGQDTVGSCTSS
jgi:uncharacterized protein YecE (DUF72 family)